MLAPALALLSPAFSPLAYAGDASLVTTTKGSISLVTAAGRSPAPPAPFVLTTGQSLDLAVGATVVLLHEGVAFSLVGPKQVDADGLQAPETNAAGPALGAILARKVSQARPGASRGPKLLRPVAGAPLVALGDVRWACAPCTDTPVTLLSRTAAEPVWSGHGAGSTRYDGQPLWPGEYSLQIGGDSYNFRVVDDAERLGVAAALDVTPPPGADPVTLATIPAAIWSQAGMPTEALYLLDRARASYPDDPELLRLTTELESRAGIHP